MKFLFLFSSIFLLGAYGLKPTSDHGYISYQVNPAETELGMVWKNKSGKIYKSYSKLKTELEAEGKQLKFAMNGGMFTTSYGPLGLYIENGEVLRKLNSKEKGYGNFYMQPNGIFMLNTDGSASVIPSSEYVGSEKIKFATQSGPLLLVNGEPNIKFTEGSKNVNIRNGVGILPNGEVLFVMSKDQVNFYDFASFFKDKGCVSALYLDGFVSRTYLPSENWSQMDGQFGVIITEVRTITD